MNWVGGSRSRWMHKNDARKQREFFEKKKMQKRIENLGLATDQQGAATGSIDLITLFIVNQIAAKKENKNCHKVTHLSPRKGARRSMNEDPLELPMSPCSPSHLSLMESQPQHSVHRRRKQQFSELHNSKQLDSLLPSSRLLHLQLSPVLESTFSDGSAADYRHVISDTFSPLSATSGSLRRTFPSEGRGEFKPFCRPREGIEATPWSAVPQGSEPDVQYPSVSRVQFGSTATSFISTQTSRGHELKTAGSFPGLSGEEMDPETAFVDFSPGVYRGKATRFDNKKIRISFQEEMPQNSIGNPKESLCRHQEADFLSKTSPIRSSAFGGCTKTCGSVCSSPCEGVFSSCSDSAGSRGGEGDQFVPSRLTAHRKNTWVGKETRPCKTREMGVQTYSISPCHTCDASTQWSPRRESEVLAFPGIAFQSHSRPVSLDIHNQATGGQHVSEDELLKVDSHAETQDGEDVLLPHTKSGVAADQSSRNTLTGNQKLPEGPENIYKPVKRDDSHNINLNKTLVTDEPRKEQTNGEQKQTKWAENYDHSTQQSVENRARTEEEHQTNELSFNKVSEETAKLQEIANILLMMKQKKQILFQK